MGFLLLESGLCRENVATPSLSPACLTKISLFGLCRCFLGVSVFVSFYLVFKWFLMIFCGSLRG